MTKSTAIAVTEPDEPAFEPREIDYATIESAVMETARGRWFLSEYARRHRHADTEQVLDAIAKLTEHMAQPAADADMDRIRMDLKEMAEAISTTRHEISAINHDSNNENQIGAASGELDSIVSETEQATSTILEAAEQVQEAAWIMREDGMDADMCDNLDGLATRIYTACSFQDITGQRTGKVIDALQQLEARIHAMSEIWDVEGWSKTEDAANISRPATPESTRLTDQSDVDQVMLDTDSAMHLQDADAEMSATDKDESEEGFTDIEASVGQELFDQLPAVQVPDPDAPELDNADVTEDVQPVATDLSQLQDAAVPDEFASDISAIEDMDTSEAGLAENGDDGFAQNALHEEDACTAEEPAMSDETFEDELDAGFEAAEAEAAATAASAMELGDADLGFAEAALDDAFDADDVQLSEEDRMDLGFTAPADQEAQNANAGDDDLDVHFADPEPAQASVAEPDEHSQQEQPVRQGASKTSAINMSALSQDDMHALFYC